jgi:DNA-binding HxlR family transcriptional regulator
MATTTATQRREQAKRDYDAFLEGCPTRELLSRLTDKWVALVIPALAGGPQRHGELAHRIAGVSQKMLTQTLRTLERDGLVTRTVTASVPVRVDYALTPLGHELFPVMIAIKNWAETHMDRVFEARTRFDARPETQDAHHLPAGRRTGGASLTGAIAR